MRIASNGYVGIGTTNPSSRLNVSGVNDAVKISGGGTSALWQTWSNSGGNYFIGISDSSGGGLLGGQNAYSFCLVTESARDMSFGTNNTQRMRITSGGALQVRSGDAGETMSVYTNISSTNWAFQILGSASINGIGTGANSAATIMRMNRDSGSLRSLNAAGSINASGADYAEYMYKAIDETIEKGDVCGVNENGELTNIFSDSLSFVVKSTNPSYVGNDIWGSHIDDKNELEIQRAKVDRIAFSGQIPCNVYNTQVGDYIIPIELDGKIIGQAVTNPTFEQYQISVGKVWKIMEDGRAWIAVKIG
jgi:hypothetical protein